MTRSTRDRQAVAEVFLSVLVARSPTGFGTEPAACVSNGSVSYPVQSDSGPLRYGSCASLVAVEVKISLFFFCAHYLFRARTGVGFSPVSSQEKMNHLR